MSEASKQPTVGELLDRLSDITNRMEQEQLPLSEMMNLFKQGKTLEKQVKEMLDLTEKQIQMLSEEEGE